MKEQRIYKYEQMKTDNTTPMEQDRVCDECANEKDIEP